MLEILVVLGSIIVVAVAGVLAYAATLSDDFKVARATTIAAPPEIVYPLIASLRAFNTWDPFSRKDPAAKIVRSGPEHGPGCAYTWEGNSNVGQGRIAITAATPSSHVTMALDMIKPLAASNTVVFTLVPSAAGTTVTWTMTGTRPYIGKVMDVVIGMERMIGGDFEKGLASLKAKAEMAG